MNLNVQLYAAAKEAAGGALVNVTLPDSATVADLRAELIRVVPALSRLQDSLLVCVDQQYAPDHQQLVQGAEVACFPPVSGG